MRNFIPLLLTSLFLISCGIDQTSEMKSQEMIKQEKIDLGRQIFFDDNLSNPIGQSCSSCHDAGYGFSDPLHSIVSEGAVKGLYGNRNAPSIAYMVAGPPLSYDPSEQVYIGGFFLDGRSLSLKHQARQPFFNKLEMNIENESQLVSKAKISTWFKQLENIYGKQLSDEKIVDAITDAIAWFESSGIMSKFSSKYDAYLRGEAKLTQQELRGLKLFNDTAKGKCANCHISELDERSGYPLFTDFTYDNLGVPSNPNNPYLTMSATINPEGIAYKDKGLGGFLKSHGENGKFKVPTLRNVAVSFPYFHNGVYSTLEDVVHFYNKRDVETFPAPEISENVNKDELGNLGLTPQEEADIVAFLKTLTDGYR